MKKAFVVVSGVVALACGGGGSGGDAGDVKFTYGASAAAAGSDLDTASNLEAQPDAVAALLGATDAAAASEAGGAIIFGAYGQVLDSFGTPSSPAAALQGGNAKPHMGLVTDPCVSFANGTLTFTNCNESDTIGDGDVAVTINGTMVASPGHATWNVSLGIDVTMPDGTIAANAQLTGDLQETSTTFKGYSRADTSLSATIDGVNKHAAVTTMSVYDLTAGDCTTGTVELKRVWTSRPPDMTADDLPNAGVLFTFGDSGGTCVVTVQHSI